MIPRRFGRWALILALLPSTPALGQEQVPEAASIDAIVDSFYSIVSGPAGFLYDAEKDRALHAPDAVITIFDQNGRFSRETLAEFQERFKVPYAEPFFEVETNRIVEEYGSMAHVWSTYEIRRAPDGPAVRRGIHSISLYQRDDRWWIASWTAQSESDSDTIPAKYLGARPTPIEGGAAPLVWPECRPEQVEVLILGTFHFAQQDDVDVLSQEAQEEISLLADALAEFRPDKVTVEHAYANNDELNAEYRRYLERADESPISRNETAQIGFRLARRLGHDRVYGVDVPMNLWHDSIQIFDDRYPGARESLRRRWDVRYPPAPDRGGEGSLVEILSAGNRDLPPANSEMYAGFLPLVEGDVYAGALKLRPWYDRNLRIVQNFFRVLEEDDDRLFLVVGWGHVRVLKQILEFTPQLCPVDPSPYLSAARG